MTDSNIIISLAACLASIASCSISYMLWKKEQPSLKVSPATIDGAQSALIFYANMDDGFQAKQRSCVMVDLVNESSRPLTLYEAQLEIENVGVFHQTQYILAGECYDFKKDENSTRSIHIGQYQIRFLYDLAAYSCIRGYLFFPIRNTVLDLNKYNAKITILTSRGSFTSQAFTLLMLP